VAKAAKTTAPAKAKTGEAKAPESKPDDLTTALMAVETKGWDAWKTRDVKGVEDVMAKDFMYFSGKGRLERADAIKGWAEPKCTGLGYTFAEPMGIQLSPDAALVTYKANVQGTFLNPSTNRREVVKPTSNKPPMMSQAQGMTILSLDAP